MRKVLAVGIVLSFIGVSVVSGFNLNLAVQNTLNTSLLPNQISNYSTCFFGTITNCEIKNNHINFQTVRTIVITFSPFSYTFYSGVGRYVEVFKDHAGFIGKHFIFALTNAYIPFIDCTKDSTLNRLIIAVAEVDVKWRNIEITTDNPVVAWQVNSGGGPLDSWNSTANITTDVLAGDFIQFTGITGNVSVTFRYIPTNVLIGTWTVEI